MHVVGTAGHVDHGKSTLVRALTGIDPDRLKEEKAREMTIDLGFAWLTLPNNDGPTRTLPTGVSFGAASTLEFWPDGSVHKQAGAENPWNVVAPTGTSFQPPVRGEEIEPEVRSLPGLPETSL